MSISLARAKKTARSLLRENRKNGRSWRVIAREDFNDQIDHATIYRFAVTKAEWMPKDPQILKALGLIKERKTIKRKTINDMTKQEVISMCQSSITRLNNILAQRGIALEVTIIKRNKS